jgi:hypothetical protein
MGLAALWLASLGMADTWNWIGVPDQLLNRGAQAAGVKTISSNLFESGGGGGPGKVVNGVNLFTGQPSYSIPLGGVSARTVQFPIVLTYSGGTKATMDNDNERAPTSWVGLGFNLTMPYVAVNHKGTYTSFDDVIFCNLGPYGGGQILADSTGTKYFVSSNPYIKIDYELGGAGEYQGQFTKWTFTFPDGKKMMFGQDTNAQRYVSYNKAIITASPYSYVPQKKFLYRWDIHSFYDTVPNLPPKNKITFEYDYFLDTTADNKSYVREGYIRNIKWMEGGLEVERYEFKTAAKGSNEYVGYQYQEPKDQQRLFETRRLDSLKCFKEGGLAHFYKFDWTSQSKGLLSKIRLFYPKTTANAYSQDSGWTFTYDPAKFNLLTSVTTPSSRVDSYTYGVMNFAATGGDQDANSYSMNRQDTINEIPLPTDTSKLSKWKAEAMCDERFCYSIVKDGDNEALSGETGITQKMYVEIRRNLGSYFDSRTLDNGDMITARFEFGDATTTADKWSCIPGGNYVLFVNMHFGNVKMYEYDGVKWKQKDPFAGSSFANGSFSGPIKVFPAANYFLVQKTDLPSQLIVAVRRDTGWTSLNRTASPCDLNNAADYGESIRTNPGGSCLEWSRNSLFITTHPAFFTVVDSATSVFNAFAMTQSGNGFEEISNKFQFFDDNFQEPGKVMNWKTQIMSVTPAEDYFIVQSKPSGGGVVYLQGFFFDGDTLRNAINHYTSGSSALMQISTSKNYFVAGCPGEQKIFFYQRFPGSPFNFFTVSTVRTDFASGSKVLLRTHPSAFTVEYYTSDSSMGLRPKWESAGTNYAAYLYQVNRSFAYGYADRTSDLTISGLNLFNVSFSGADNMLLGARASNAGSRCNQSADVGPCTISYYTARFHPDNTTTFINQAGRDTAGIVLGVGTPLRESHRVMSGAAPLGVNLVLDNSSSPKRIRLRYYQFDGKGFGVPDSQFTVTAFQSHSSLADEDRNRIVHQYYYPPSGAGSGSAGIAEFNGRTLSPQFEFADVRQVKADLATTGTVRTVFHLDHAGNPLGGKAMFLIGTEKSTSTIRPGADTASYATTVNDPYRNTAWPQSLYITRLKSAISRNTAPNGSCMSDTTYYFNFCDINGAPRFTLQNSGPQKILLSQRIFDGLGFTKQALAYKLPTQPDTFFLKVWEPERVYSITGAIRASKSVHSGYYFLRDSLWREMDQSLTDSDLRTGKAPTFSLNEGWLPATQVTIRDTANFFQILESKVVKNGLSGASGESHASTFYEGLRSDPVAVVQNSKLANCAILMGEDGNAGLSSGLDQRGRWANNGCAFSPLHVHSGRYGIKVTDDYGPAVNLYLKDVRELGYGFRVSAWIYADTGTPKLMAERWNASGVKVNDYEGAPVSGIASMKKTWQRWELRLTHAQLISGGLFNGSADYLRIWVGTGATGGGGSNAIYVDDIVCLPSNASFTLATYDKSGINTSVTNGNHVSTFFDIGPTGRVMAVRDERFRTFGQTAAHKMGEN